MGGCQRPLLCSIIVAAVRSFFHEAFDEMLPIIRGRSKSAFRNVYEVAYGRSLFHSRDA